MDNEHGGASVVRIAVVGSGISGLTAAHYLDPRHEVTVFEAGSWVGGHTHTVDVEFEGEHATIDTGFIVFNDWTYPNFIALLERLGVAWQDSDMSFSLFCEETGWEYNGGSLSGLFVRKRNLVRPAFWRMLADIVRFNRTATRVLARGDEPTVGQFLREEGYSREFAEKYLLPMGAAIWSCPTGTFAEFPMRFIAEFYSNHGLLSVFHRPTWRVIAGGSRSYVERLVSRLRGRVHVNAPVESIRRIAGGVELRVGGETRPFDEVIVACHADQALRLLAEPRPIERELLAKFPYQANDVVLHTDESVLPPRRGAWAAWNYRIPRGQKDAATLTYNMNILQGLNKRHTYCVTLNSTAQVDAGRILGRYEYHHPVFTIERGAAQRRHAELVALDGLSYCGAYWGNGFHEDGVNSALAVCRQLDPECLTCTAASTRA